MQRFHIAQWHDGLKRSGKAGITFRWPHMEKNTAQLLASLLDTDRRWTAREFAAEVGVCHKTVLHILHDILGYRKFAARWISHEIFEVQQWHRYAVAHALLDRYKREYDDFLNESSLCTKPGLALKNQTWKAIQMNGSIPFIAQRKCVLHNVFWMWCSLWRMTLMG